MADIYISSTDRSSACKLPFLPESLPEISRTAKNQEFETYANGTYNILGAAGLREIPLEGILPGKRYSFARSDALGGEVIDMLERAMQRKKPLRLTIVGRRSENLLVSVESLSWHEDRAGDIAYSVSFKEYRNV